MYKIRTLAWLCYLFIFVFKPVVFALENYGAGQKVEDDSSDHIEFFLDQVRKKSRAIKNAELEFKSSKLLNEIDLSEFDWSAFLNLSRLSATDPQRNPFSPIRNDIDTIGLGVAKKWAYGFETNFNYNVTDNFIRFPPSAPVGELNYFFPDLSFEFKTNITDDLIYKQSLNKVIKIKRQNETLEIDKKIKIRENLVSALLDVTSYVEVKNEINLQEKICSEISKQNKKLQKKRKLGSISKRDYLTSQKEYNSCQIIIRTLRAQKLSLVNSLETNYNLNRSAFLNFEIENLFLDIKKLYEKFMNLQQKVDLKSTIQIKSLKQKMKVLQAEHKQLKAGSKLDVFLEAKYGLRGLNNNYPEAQDNIASSDFPNYYVGLKVNLPFKDRNAETLLASNSYKKEVLSLNYDQMLTQKTSEFFVLQATLDDNLLIYEKLEENYKLSREILNEGLKDFNNGRIDFFNLTELRKSFLQSQNQMIQFRRQILVNIVEYIDYFNYFERYY